MALFFDQSWFDARLDAIGKSRADVAAALALSDAEVAEIWKDQRELTPGEVTVLAGLLEASPAEIVDKAGVATPMPLERAELADLDAVIGKLDDMNGRLQRIERAVVELKALVLDQRRTE